ncbi:MAG: hypothetical protein A2096_00370 [Spirochaetes bacterium GWF1_41_5]|nr:MAG: hypothetical protein A2096_00370 [Spirochaetes bacterium GWF1_41_5]
MFKKLITAFLTSGLIFIYSQGTGFTNLFEESDEDKLETEAKKRSAYSVLNSGNKIGVQIGYNYVVNNSPNMVAAFLVDVPFAKIMSFSFLIGLETLGIGSFVNDDTDGSASVIPGTEIAQGDGELNYLTMNGVFKFFIKSVWIGAGLSYYRFLNGNIQAKIPDTVYYLNYKIDNYRNDFYATVSIGYLAEIRENIFILPEIKFAYLLPPAGSRILITLMAGLAFRL